MIPISDFIRWTVTDPNGPNIWMNIVPGSGSDAEPEFWANSVSWK